MADAPENPAAFPSRLDRPMIGGGSYRADRPGMTLRDWFAGQALAGLLAKGAGVAGYTPSKAAEDAFITADKMLAERAK